MNALQNGARGLPAQDMEPDDLIKALNDIVAGQTVVAPELTIVWPRRCRVTWPPVHPPPRTGGTNASRTEILVPSG